MFQFFITFLILNSSSAFLSNYPDFLYLENFNYDVNHDEPAHEDIQQDLISQELWALDVDSSILDQLKLRKASSEEVREFDDNIGPIIESVESIQRPSVIKVKNSRNLNNGENNGRVKEEIMRVVNKFVLSSNMEPTVHLPENNDEYTTPSLVLYFKGRYSALIIKYGRNEWRFFINDPSPLPEWFYTKHSSEQTYIKVPITVQSEFYTTFLRLVKMFLRFDM